MTMRKTAFIIAAILLLASVSLAQEQVARMSPAVVAAGVRVAGCSYTTCSAGCKLFDWDGSTTSMASNVCSLGDSTATLEGEADVTTNPGYITLVDTSNNGNDNYKFTMSSYDLWPSGDATLEMTINMSVINANAELFSVYLASTDYFRVFFTGASNDIFVTHKGAGGTAVSKTFDVNLSTGVSYSLVIKISTTLGMSIKVNSDAAIVDATKTITTMTHSGSGANTFVVGNDAAYNLEGTITNVRVSAGWRNDI